MNPKDRSLICRMAGNIAGHLDTGRERDVARAVDIAISTIEETDRRIALEKEKNPT